MRQFGINLSEEVLVLMAFVPQPIDRFIDRIEAQLNTCFSGNNRILDCGRGKIRHTFI